MDNENANIQLLLDRAEISDVQLRYATGLDSRDWPLFRSCFADEIETDFTSVFGGEPRKVSADRWTEAARRSIIGLAATQHMITNHVITVAGDTATCIAYVQARHYLPNDSGDSMQTMFGYYTNRLVRTSAGWKIRACKLTLTMQTGNPQIFTLASERVKAAEASKKS
jgi:3-phenylpropionate/cinnamic acid dioxygenase small subunit